MIDTLKNWFMEHGADLAASILTAVIVTVVGILAIRLIMNILKRILEKSKLEKAAHSLIKTLVKTTLYVLLALMVASGLGIDVTGVVALASVLTLAVSLALQNMLANVIGGFTLLYTHPFHSGDFVEVAGKLGTVTEVGIAYTKLMAPDLKMISIPNSSVIATDIINYSSSPTRRVDIPVTAAYDAPVDKVLAALTEAAKVEGVLEDPATFITVTGYSDTVINYVIRVWVNNADYWNVNFAITRRVKEVFDAQGIRIADPHLTVRVNP